METSAKSGQNVELAFTAVARYIKKIKVSKRTKSKICYILNMFKIN